MRLLKILLIIFSSLFFSCLASMETARINKGYNANLHFQYINLNIKDKPTNLTRITDSSLFVNFRATRGFEWKIPFELGVTCGLYLLPQFSVVITRDINTGQQITDYYPSGTAAKPYFTYSGKFQVYNKNDITLAVKPQFYLDRFSSASIIASREFEKFSPYISFKVFNRFIPELEKKIDDRKFGYYISIGNKYQVKRYREKSRLKYFFELGLVKNYWYNDRIALVLSAGISIK